MEGRVFVPLGNYDKMKDRIYALETENRELKGKLESLKIFKVAKSELYGKEDVLDLGIEPDAQKYLDKAFANYAGSYTPKHTDSLIFFGYARPNNKEDK